LAEELQSKRFARAVFEIAHEHNQMDAWSRDLAKMAALAHNQTLVSALENPRFTFENKKKLLAGQLQGIGALAQNLAYVLTAGGHFHIFPQVADEYAQLLAEDRGIARAEVTTAVPLDDEERKRITAQLGVITGKKVTIVEKVDAGILGGMVARVEGKIIDGSTRSQLDRLKSQVAGAGA
jgi:F-type H+-transporting ATPase subunit delta